MPGQEQPKEEKAEAPKCCEGCVRWEKFGKECWVYWELKKECSQHSADWSEQTQQSL